MTVTPPSVRRMRLFGDIANCLLELMPGYVDQGPYDVVSEFAARFGRRAGNGRTQRGRATGRPAGGEIGSRRRPLQV